MNRATTFAFLPDFGHSACSATGDTPDEALSRLSEVKGEVVRHYLETGKAIPEPGRGPHEEPVLQQMPVRVPKDIHDRLKRFAKDSGMSLNSYLIRVFSEHLAAQGSLQIIESRMAELLRMAVGGVGPAHRDIEWKPVEIISDWQRYGTCFAAGMDASAYFETRVKFLPVANQNSEPMASLEALAAVEKPWGQLQ